MSNLPGHVQGSDPLLLRSSSVGLEQGVERRVSPELREQQVLVERMSGAEQRPGLAGSLPEQRHAVVLRASYSSGVSRASKGG
jgi:hypothetical protein